MPTSAPSALIVEDEPRYRDFLAEVVEGMQLTPIPAGTASQAARLAEASSPDLLLLDLNLPVTDGITFLEQFRRLRPNTPVIIITGFGDLDSAKKAIRLGITDFLTKPCDIGQIEQAISLARLRTGAPRPSRETLTSPNAVAPDVPAVPLAQIERQAILDTLNRTRGNRSAAARELGISRRSLYNKLAEYEREGHEIP